MHTLVPTVILQVHRFLREFQHNMDHKKSELCFICPHISVSGLGVEYVLRKQLLNQTR